MSLRFSNREKFSILLGSSWMAVNMLSHYRTVYQQILPKKVPSWSVMSVETADNVDEAVRELPDANLFTISIHLQVVESGEKIGLKHFRPVKPLGSGDTGRRSGKRRTREKKNLEFVDPYSEGDFFSPRGEKKRLPTFYAAEVVVALEYLHCQAWVDVIYSLRLLVELAILVQLIGGH
ncbi:hypothetical protein GW17_00002209 [Ensete ventricosum]|nr:hypothetical protein GW17_00002209 [Ensete ventricosum]